MDSPSVEQSDSDSGESWTLLENNSIYADEAPEFIEEQDKHGAQHHEKDEDTDGISIISDSDHEVPSPLPPPPDETIYNSYQVQENLLSEKNLSEYVSVDPLLPNNSDDDSEPATSEAVLGDSHAKHKTYVHRRNKRLSTVLNVIVLGSVITAVGVAIGHMWGAKNDCTIQTTSSVNKILSNLYKLQEENAYLRSKLKELTFNNRQIQQQKIPLKHNKCKKVFEESLSNNEPRKLTKCVDDNDYTDHLIEHVAKPKFEKEFIGDIDKLKTVYLQNKSWLDDEISRRMKIEEELVKKYNNEVNSAKDKRKTSMNEKQSKYSDNTVVKGESLDNFVEFENPGTYMLSQKKVSYADSLQPEREPRFRRSEKTFSNDFNNDWLTSKHNINNFEQVKGQDSTSNDQLKQDQTDVNHKPVLRYHQAHHLTNDGNNLESAPTNNNRIRQLDFDWINVKPKFRRNEERYETDNDNSFLESIQKNTDGIIKQQQPSDNWTKEKIKFEMFEIEEDNNWSKYAKETKNIRKKEKKETMNSSKRNPDVKKKNRILENVLNEQHFIKDDRYFSNKIKQDKKKNGHFNFDKKQKRKMKQEKFNIKGEYGDSLAAVTHDDYHPDENNNFESVSFLNNIDDSEKLLGSNQILKNKSEKLPGKDEYLDKKILKKTLGDNWFEKRAVFRTEARKKYYEQFRETSPNNSSWYFRRMRKREQCRAKGDNPSFRKIYKEKKNRN